MLGSAGTIVMDETTDLVEVLLRICKFYSWESCGQCTPCREGTGWMTRIMERIVEGSGHSRDLDDLVDIARKIEGNTICPLGDAAALPVISFVTKFREEFEERISPTAVAVGGAGEPSQATEKL